MKKVLRFIGIFAACILVLLLIGFAIGFFSTSGEYVVPATVERDSTLPRIEFGNTIFHGETFGSDTNPVVIVLHGGPGDDYKNLLALKALEDEFFVVFYDQRGAGLSPRVDPELITLQSYIDDLHLFVTHFGKGRPVNLIGHSWGAMLASGYIGTYPHTINKAVLAEPGFLNTETLQSFMEKTGGFAPKLSFALIIHTAKSFFRMLHVSGADNHAKLDYFMHSVMTAPIAGSPIAGYFCNQQPSAAAFDKWRFGSRASLAAMNMIKSPTGQIQLNLAQGVDQFKNEVLFLASECNTISGEQHQLAHMKLFPNARLSVIPNTGHFMFAEQPQLCIDIVRDYLNTGALRHFGKLNAAQAQ